jgi:hypothetical protein
LFGLAGVVNVTAVAVLLVIFLEAKTRPVFATRRTVLLFAPTMLAVTVYRFEAALCTCGARALTAVVLRPTPAASKATIANILHELEIFISVLRIVKYQFLKKSIYLFRKLWASFLDRR